eukprot:TRINITY_DN40803_c0_g1_i1.p1 TRINITY_DN40803_c0_g1~~TRINITY_DN40803_c0_g1_i1.p1  ORF type:complete len:1472 (+),score=380.68 TRINITY_DN40803_c0_g1_i1:656-4417(+)
MALESRQQIEELCQMLRGARCGEEEVSVELARHKAAARAYEVEKAVLLRHQFAAQGTIARGLAMALEQTVRTVFFGWFELVARLRTETKEIIRSEAAAEAFASVHAQQRISATKVLTRLLVHSIEVLLRGAMAVWRDVADSRRREIAEEASAASAAEAVARNRAAKDSEVAQLRESLERVGVEMAAAIEATQTAEEMLGEVEAVAGAHAADKVREEAAAALADKAASRCRAMFAALLADHLEAVVRGSFLAWRSLLASQSDSDLGRAEEVGSTLSRSEFMQLGAVTCSVFEAWRGLVVARVEKMVKRSFAAWRHLTVLERHAAELGRYDTRMQEAQWEVAKASASQQETQSSASEEIERIRAQLRRTEATAASEAAQASALEAARLAEVKREAAADVAKARSDLMIFAKNAAEQQKIQQRDTDEAMDAMEAELTFHEEKAVAASEEASQLRQEHAAILQRLNDEVVEMRQHRNLLATAEQKVEMAGLRTVEADAASASSRGFEAELRTAMQKAEAERDALREHAAKESAAAATAKASYATVCLDRVKESSELRQEHTAALQRLEAELHLHKRLAATSEEQVERSESQAAEAAVEVASAIAEALSSRNSGEERAKATSEQISRLRREHAAALECLEDEATRQQRFASDSEQKAEFTARHAAEAITEVRASQATIAQFRETLQKAEGERDTACEQAGKAAKAAENHALRAADGEERLKAVLIEIEQHKGAVEAAEAQAELSSRKLAAAVAEAASSRASDEERATTMLAETAQLRDQHNTTLQRLQVEMEKQRHVTAAVEGRAEAADYQARKSAEEVVESQHLVVTLRQAMREVAEDRDEAWAMAAQVRVFAAELTEARKAEAEGRSGPSSVVADDSVASESMGQNTALTAAVASAPVSSGPSPTPTTVRTEAKVEPAITPGPVPHSDSLAERGAFSGSGSTYSSPRDDLTSVATSMAEMPSVAPTPTALTEPAKALLASPGGSMDASANALANAQESLAGTAAVNIPSPAAAQTQEEPPAQFAEAPERVAMASQASVGGAAEATAAASAANAASASTATAQTLAMTPEVPTTSAVTMSRPTPPALDSFEPGTPAGSGNAIALAVAAPPEVSSGSDSSYSRPSTPRSGSSGPASPVERAQLRLAQTSPTMATPSPAAATPSPAATAPPLPPARFVGSPPSSRSSSSDSSKTDETGSLSTSNNPAMVAAASAAAAAATAATHGGVSMLAPPPKASPPASVDSGGGGWWQDYGESGEF